jgi:hypothetical protein
VLALLKYKDNEVAKNIIRMISYHTVVYRHKTELSSIINTKLKTELLSELNAESYKKRKINPHDLMHPIISFYTIMHIVINDSIILEKSLTQPIPD